MTFKRGAVATCCAVLLAAVFGAVSPSRADGWPSRQVTMIVPFGAGSTPDLAARMIGDRLAARIGQPVVIENITGASGNLGTAAIAHAAPDGQTIGVSIVGPLALNTLLFSTMPYNPKTDLAPVGVLVSQPNVLVASKSLGVTTAADLIAKVKAVGDTLNFGSIGNGSLSHLAMEAIAIKAGKHPVHVPFNGSPAVVTALIQGQVQMAVLPAGSVVPLARAGKIVMLAVSSAKRSKLLPDLPTLAELGVPGVEAEAWIGLVAPAKTDPAILERLGSEVRAVLAEPALVEKLQNQYMEVVGSDGAAMSQRLDDELARWSPIIRANNIHMGQ